jgi:hypothetical protein
MGRFRAFSKRDTKKPLFPKKMKIKGPFDPISGRSTEPLWWPIDPGQGNE